MNYIYTIGESQSERDAIDAIISVLEIEHSVDIREKKFKRVLAQTNDEIDKRLKKMDNNSPGEYSYKGVDSKGLAIYTFWVVV